MAGKFTLNVLLLLVIVTTAQALKCLTCLGSLTSDCYEAKAASAVVESCGVKPSAQKMFPFSNISLGSGTTLIQHCIQVVVKLKSYDKPAIQRSCIPAPSDIKDVCKSLGASWPIEKCRACKDKDLCNNLPGGK